MRNSYINSWQAILNDPSRSGIIRHYQTFKSNFCFEPYLNIIRVKKHLIALSRFRASSHRLRCETGRWDDTIENLRLCPHCGVTDSEIHLVCSCTAVSPERDHMISKLVSHLGDDSVPFIDNLYNNLIRAVDPIVIIFFADFLFTAFRKRYSLQEGSSSQ